MKRMRLDHVSFFLRFFSLFWILMVIPSLGIAVATAPTPASEPRNYSQTGAGDLSLGLIIGSPVGMSLKYWTSHRNAFDAAMGIPMSSDAKFDFHMDALWQLPLNTNFPGELPFVLGVGGRVRAYGKSDNNPSANVGVRFPVGVEFLPRAIALDFFVELAPVIVLAPNPQFDLDGGVGVRYRFGPK